MTVTTLDERALATWGRALGEAAARDNVFVALFGPLGAGKTRLAQAACAGAGVRDLVTSPTYTVVHWYVGDRGRIAHADLYRVAEPSELLAIGWEELESGACPVFVEWAERAGDELPPDRWEIRLELDGEDTRRIRTAAIGVVPPVPEPLVGPVERGTGPC